MSELISQVPIFEQAATSIKETGSFQKELSSQDMESIMKGVVSGLLEGQEAVHATVPTMNVQIENGKGIINGSVQVEKPIKATIDLECTLGNDNDPNKIRLVDLDVKTKAGFVAKAALKAANIEGRARNVLSDPNIALSDALKKQLEPKGVVLTGSSLHFGDKTLNISLSGKAT